MKRICRINLTSGTENQRQRKTIVETNNKNDGSGNRQQLAINVLNKNAKKAGARNNKKT
jgi:hypothetical protein